jgi:hypothetical protein
MRSARIVISIYIHEIPEAKRMLTHDTLWNILFNPQEIKLKSESTLKASFRMNNIDTHFMNRVYIGIDDPKDWDKWVFFYRY